VTAARYVSGQSIIILKLSGFDIGSYADRLCIIDGFKIWSPDELRALPEGRFHVITRIEVVEHLSEPLSVFKLLARSLAQNGLLLGGRSLGYSAPKSAFGC
jgi:hypothetical protein